MWVACSSAALPPTPKLALVFLSLVSLDSCQELAKTQVAEETTQTLPLSAEGRIEVASSCGAITITGWEREECGLRAVKRAADSAQLSLLTLEVDASNDRIAIRATVPQGLSGNPDRGPRIDITLRVPRQAHMEKIVCGRGDVTIRDTDGDVVASSVNGSVVAEGTTGNLRLKCVNGRTVARLASLGTGRSADLETVNGSTSVVLPAQASVDVHAYVANGSVLSDLGLPVEDDFPAGRKMEGRLGVGGAAVTARTANGSVSVWKSAPAKSPTRSTTVSEAGDDAGQAAGSGH